MFRLIYVSEESAPFSVSNLLELLNQCHVNNPRLNVTGMLMYGNGTFLQTIEGEEEVVKALAEKISRDRRHRGFKVVRSETIRERLYPDWSMRFERLTEESLRKVPGLRDFALKKFNRDYLGTHLELVDTLAARPRQGASEPSTSDGDHLQRQLVELRKALDASQQRQEMAALLIESLIESATRGRLDDPQLRLCRSMLTSLRGRSKGAVARA